MNDSTPKKGKEEFKTLDLSNLTATELPVEEIELEFKNGKKQTVSFHPFDGRGEIAWGGNAKNVPENVAFEDRAILTALIYGADLSEEVADLFMRNEPQAARKLGNAVWRLHGKYKKAMEEEAKDAEKNSETAETASQGSSASAGTPTT